MTLILGIESSCDDTCVALVDSERNIISNIISSQHDEHAKYKGVVPEIASRLHLLNIKHLAESALANHDIRSLAAVAATGGPGLIGGLITGVTFAKAISSSLGIPFIAINHLEGHALTVRLTHGIKYPYLLLLMSGGHCQFVAVLGLGRYTVLGSTLDDALGEVFDKLAKMLNLGYPGGPIVEDYARNGNPYAFALPHPLMNEPGSDLSFSGLKTSLRHLILSLGTLSQKHVADICASFQYTVGRVLVRKCMHAIDAFRKLAASKEANTLVLSGGVAANLYLRQIIGDFAEKQDFILIAPPLRLCTDNAAMIAWAAQERFKFGQSTQMYFRPLSRWPMDSLSIS